MASPAETLILLCILTKVKSAMRDGSKLLIKLAVGSSKRAAETAQFIWYHDVEDNERIKKPMPI